MWIFCNPMTTWGNKLLQRCHLEVRSWISFSFLSAQLFLIFLFSPLFVQSCSLEKNLCLAWSCVCENKLHSKLLPLKKMFYFWTKKQTKYNLIWLNYPEYVRLHQQNPWYKILKVTAADIHFLTCASKSAPGILSFSSSIKHQCFHCIFSNTVP